MNQIACDTAALAAVSQVPEKTIRKYYHIILKHFNLKLRTVPASSQFTHFCVTLGLPAALQSCGLRVLTLLKKKKVHFNNPKGIAAALVYFLSKHLVQGAKGTQRMLAALAKVSEVTIRNYLRTLEKEVHLQEVMGIQRRTTILSQPLDPRPLKHTS